MLLFVPSECFCQDQVEKMSAILAFLRHPKTAIRFFFIISSE